MKSNTDFVNYLLNILKKNTVYMWGGYGKLVTEEHINEKALEYPSHYPEDKINHLKSLIGKGYYSYDCSGLINSYWMTNFGSSESIYNEKFDLYSYDLVINNASEIGNINCLPEIPGLLLYMEGHCGVYIGNGKVIECTSNEEISM